MKRVTATFLVPDDAESVEQEFYELAERIGEHAMYVAVFLGVETTDATPQDIEYAHKLGYDDELLGVEE